MQPIDRPCALVILAAGQGTRMNSDLPKVLHPLGKVPLVVHAMAAGAALAPEKTIVIVGHGGDAVEKAVMAEDDTALCLRQADQLGTGHAVRQAAPALDGFQGDVIVLYGDTPFISDETLARMLAALRDAWLGGLDILREHQRQLLFEHQCA